MKHGRRMKCWVPAFSFYLWCFRFAYLTCFFWTLSVFLKFVHSLTFLFLCSNGKFIMFVSKWFQTQFLIQECSTLLSKPNFVSTLCNAIDHPLHHQKVCENLVYKNLWAMICEKRGLVNSEKVLTYVILPSLGVAGLILDSSSILFEDW